MIALLTAGGCTTYRAQQLDLAAVNRALEIPEPEAIRVSASAIQHPILHPLAFDLSDGLSADEAAILAVITNPTLRAQRGKRQVAQAQLLQAGLLPNPQVSASFDQPVGGSTAGTMTGWGLGLDYDLTTLITRGAEIDASKAEAASVDLDVAWAEWQAAEEAKLHVARLTWLRRQYDEAAAAQQRAEQTTSSIRQALREGMITQTELDAAETELQRFKLTTLETENAMDSERLDLNLSIGFPSEVIMAIQDGPIAAAPMQPSPQQIASNLEIRRLDLIALRLGYQSQESKLRAAVLSQFPKITVGVNGASDTSNVITAGMGVTLELPIFDRAQGRIAIEKATRQQLFDEYVARSFEARSDIAKLYSRLHSVTKRIEATDAYVDRLQALQTTYSNAVKAGAADVLNLYQVQNTLADTRLEALKLRQEQAELLIGLEVAQGQIIPSTTP